LVDEKRTVGAEEWRGGEGRDNWCLLAKLVIIIGLIVGIWEKFQGHTINSR